MNKFEIRLAIAALEPEDIMCAYSGTPGRCCCGCSGKYSYNSRYIAEATKDRGYAVTAEDVNDRQVAKVLRILKERAAEAECFGSGFSIQVSPTREYNIYPMALATGGEDKVLFGTK